MIIDTRGPEVSRGNFSRVSEKLDLPSSMTLQSSTNTPMTEHKAKEGHVHLMRQSEFLFNAQGQDPLIVSKGISKEGGHP